MAKTILIVDDDPHIREVVAFALDKAGMKTIEAADGQKALGQARHEPDLIILDINMPEMDGLDVCKEIRKGSDLPILFLSSRDEEIDRILGLEIGADDYLVKPFSPRELVARVKAILKRCENRAPALQSGQISTGALVLDADQYIVLWDSKSIDLTATEFAILKGMIASPGRVFERDTIMAMAYSDQVYVSDRTIDSHIRHIRQKFSEQGCEMIIETVRGVGYKLSV